MSVSAVGKDHAGVRSKRQGQFGQVMHRLRKNKVAMIGLGIMIVLIAVALLSPWITPYNYAKTSKANRYTLQEIPRVVRYTWIPTTAPFRMTDRLSMLSAWRLRINV